MLCVPSGYGCDVACSCVVLGTLVGVLVFSVMWLELMMMLEIRVPL